VELITAISVHQIDVPNAFLTMLLILLQDLLVILVQFRIVITVLLQVRVLFANQDIKKSF